MTAFCPHCSAALSTYTTIEDSEPTNVEVLVCAHCDKVLGVVGPARVERRRMDVDAIADLLNVAVSTDDEGEALTVFSVVIEQINRGIETEGGDVIDGGLFDRLLRTFLERQRELKRQRDQADAGRPP